LLQRKLQSLLLSQQAPSSGELWSLLFGQQAPSFSGAPEVAQRLLLLQRSKLRSSGEAPKAPCCNATSFEASPKLRSLLLLQRRKVRSSREAPEKLQKLLAATLQAPKLLRSSGACFCCNAERSGVPKKLRKLLAVTQQAAELRKSSGSSLLQCSKLWSSGKAPKAPCCNAASCGALEKLWKLLAATQQAAELRSLLLSATQKAPELRRSSGSNKLRSSEAYFCYNGAFAATELAAVLQQAPSS